MLNQYFTYLLYRNFHMILMLFSPIKYRSFKLIFTNLWANQKKGVSCDTPSLLIFKSVLFHVYFNPIGTIWISGSLNFFSWLFL